jgi:hypothetical protein
MQTHRTGLNRWTWCRNAHFRWCSRTEKRGPTPDASATPNAPRPPPQCTERKAPRGGAKGPSQGVDNVRCRPTIAYSGRLPTASRGTPLIRLLRFRGPRTHGSATVSQPRSLSLFWVENSMPNALPCCAQQNAGGFATPKAPIDPLQICVARPVPVATQGPRDSTKTIIRRPELAKRLAQGGLCARSRVNQNSVERGLSHQQANSLGRANGTLDAFVWRSRRRNH